VPLEIDVKDDNKLRSFYDKRISQEVDGKVLGEAFDGYVFKITGGCDNQGFPMKQGVLTSARVRLLLNGETGCFNPLRKGQRKRKSVRGCIVSNEIASLHLVVVKKGDQDIPKLTDSVRPRTRGPKRASKIRALFNLGKKEDPRGLIRQVKERPGKQPRIRNIKVQRLVTPEKLRRARSQAIKRRLDREIVKEKGREYVKFLTDRYEDQNAKRRKIFEQKRAQHGLNLKSQSASKAKKPKAESKPKPKTETKTESKSKSKDSKSQSKKSTP